MELQREGTKLFYELSGTGEHAFIFLHGIGLNHQFFSSEINFFNEKSRVLSVDLRGHGQSDKPNQGYTPEEYAQDLAFLCEQTKIKKAIVVGHSLGGSIALELSFQFPALVSAVILLDANVTISPERLSFLSGMLEKLKSQFQPTIEKLISDQKFCSPAQIDFLKKSFFATPQHVWVSCMEELIHWNQRKAQTCLRDYSFPLLYIEGGKIASNLTRFDEACQPSTVVRGRVVGAGHFFPLEVPDQVISMIDRFISMYVKNP
jgi:pimeloyl-ACP methyl ester carboxylesterase